MAGSFSDTLEQNVLNFWFRANPGSLTSPAAVYVGLFTVAPGETGGGTEVTTSGTAYARQSVTFGAPTNTGSTPTAISNSSDVVFPVASANYGTVLAWGIYDALTVGNLLAYGTFTGVAVNSGNQAKFAASSLQITLD